MDGKSQKLIEKINSKIREGKIPESISNLIDELVIDVVENEKSLQQQIENYRSQIHYLDGCVNGFRKELTNTLNSKENTNQGLFTLLSSIPNLVYFKDTDLRFVIVNHAFESWINKSFVEINGKSDADVYPDYLNRNILKLENEVLKTGVGIYNFEEKLNIDGSEIWLLTSISPYKNAEGELRGIITSSLDISMRKKHELELEEANNRAQIALNIRNEFLANMSHELRTPLHGIAGSAEILLQKKLDKESRHLVNIIDQSSHILSKQLNDLLIYTQAENHQLDVHTEEFNLKSDVEELIGKNLKTIEAKGVELRWFINESIPDLLKGDKYKIVLLLETLLSNSIKFTEKGFVHLIVKESQRDLDKLCIRFDLIDTGIGIPFDKQGEIFELFSTGDSSSSKKYSGTGLGLSLAKKMLDILNAKYGFESKEHVGSHFWFELELQMLQFEKEIEQVSAQDLPVLLVEDNIVNQKIAFFTLKKLGFPVDIAENGEEAVEKFRKKKYRLVLMDIQMPVMDGFEATKQIRQLEKNNMGNSSAIIIALSANILSRDIQNCFEVGMNEFISKPFSSDKLMDKIKIYFKLK